MRRHLRKNNQLRKIIACNLGLSEWATWEEIGNRQNEQILKQKIEETTQKEEELDLLALGMLIKLNQSVVPYILTSPKDCLAPDVGSKE